MRGHYKVQGGEVHDVQSCDAAEMQEDLRFVHRAAALPGDAADVAAEVGDSGSFQFISPQDALQQPNLIGSRDTGTSVGFGSDE